VAANAWERGAEMAPMQRDYESNPPPCHLGAAAADTREDAAELQKRIAKSAKKKERNRERFNR